MKVPKKIRCELSDSGEDRICNVDLEGWGDCGDGVIDEHGVLCPWVKEVFEWQDIEPVYLKQE